MFHDTTKLQNATRIISNPKKIRLAKIHSVGLATLFARTNRAPKNITSPIFSHAEKKMPSCPQRYRVNGFDSNLGFVTRISIALRRSNEVNQGAKECFQAILHPKRIRLPDTYGQLQLIFRGICTDPVACFYSATRIMDVFSYASFIVFASWAYSFIVIRLAIWFANLYLVSQYIRAFEIRYIAESEIHRSFYEIQ